MRYLILFICIALLSPAFGQKMLLIEKANRARTTKMYVGETLHFRLKGKENYWYTRTITDILPESNTLLLDNFPVKLDSIGMLKVSRRQVWRLFGASFFTLGASLALATTVGKVIYQDENVDAPKLYALSAVSLGAGWFMLSPRKLKLGEKFRLRIIEIKFPDPIIPPPPDDLRH
ncbi:MAG: hypothetical protein R3A50_03515 [Saprospiraceae bacterium]|nr:hypothetical protein [Saprospiraceae bacterium]MCB9343742.1 hypothetical protein [Lewinellaceae bacterium]